MLLALLLALLLAQPAHAGAGGRCYHPPFDWCASYLDDPYSNAPTPRYGLERSLYAAQIVEIGSSMTLTGDLFPAAASTPYGLSYGPAVRWVHQRRREIAAARGLRMPKRYKAMRFDLLMPQQLARGVRDGTLKWKCLLEAEDQLPELLTALTATQEPDYFWNYNYQGADEGDHGTCKNAAGTAVACEFVESVALSHGATPDPEGDGLLKELCVQGGGTSCNTAYQRAIYYIARGLSNRSGGATFDEMSATAVRMKQNDAECAAWEAANAKREIEDEDYDGVQLNYKPDWRWTAAGPLIGPAVDALSRFRSVAGTACDADDGTGCDPNWMQAALGPHDNFSTSPSQMRDTPGSSVPKGCSGNFQDLVTPFLPATSGDPACTYRESDYDQGEKMTADALLAAGVPYHLFWGGNLVDPLTSTYDDSTTTGVNEETAYLDPAMAGAERAAIDVTQPDIPAANVSAILAVYPNAYVAQSACTASVPPEAGCTPAGVDSSLILFPTFLRSGNNLVWGPFDGANTPTGTWSGKVFNNCPAVNAKVSPTAAGCTGAVATPSGIADGNTQTTALSWTVGQRIAWEVTQGSTCGVGASACTAWDWCDTAASGGCQ